MSLQGLVSGSECAVPFNPLSQVLKHTEGDRSVQQLHHLPTTTGPATAEQDRSLARQFFEGAPQNGMPNGFSTMPHVLPPQMALHAPRVAPADLNGAWVEVHDRGLMMNQEHAQGSSGWASEFGGASHILPSGPVPQGQGFQQQQQPSYMSSMTSGMYGMRQGMMYPMNMGAVMSPPPIQATDKGKGKNREIDFDAAFAQLDEALGPSPEEAARVAEFDDVADLSEAMERAQLREAAEQNKERVGSDFETVWDHLKSSELPPPDEELAKWEAQYRELMESHRSDMDFDYGASLGEAWRNSEFDDEFTKTMFDDEGVPQLQPYMFEPENKYMDPSTHTSSSLNDAKALLEQGGSLTEVGLMLEAAIQKGDLGRGGYEAWILLGEVRSMDEREDASMRALNEGVKRAVETGAAGEGMISLAISFTNENYERASHTMLLRWLHARHPEFPIPQEAWDTLRGSAWASHERVTETFINLAREQHGRGELDADVQIGLGVLFYTHGLYDRAKDCFETALSVRPNDYLLWNRLGSSLSNGSKPEEALGAYKQALQLRPTYTRAIYNVGVACLNLGAHKEAAEHFLSTLVMQDSDGKGTKSDQVWITLSKTFTAMDRPDLADRARAGADLEVFRREGFDF
ncbi:uncharacterized protein PHACADRAFT_97499 [Phanerochaete carnosa HHB-10118-sp]|uniref:Uncharacterized protein n=1 Tax=Phanerochaete carnosa (strain HHB-10118-sp) TaxID=650164 RepID=K5W540_PHACS|nr:uncharacterized protein PHACADRAFT_97499 [Phanerochaete carnosa HHB-10118-sp]EKM54250.1 hypothetical protein PHACADRAFT_97499 [Phanerochaete carnosa HHB-10118-sp]